MPGAAILGAQWGDEGKGKIVDYFAGSADCVVRFQGGPNAGHTIEIERDGETRRLVLHQIPSGLFHPETHAVMGRGMVVDPATLLAEVESLQRVGIDVRPDRLHLSFDAHVVLPIHRAIDKAREQALHGGKIGTTLRGVGPAYEDRVARRGVRFRDLSDEAVLIRRLERLLFERNTVLAAYGGEPVGLDEHLEHIATWRQAVLAFGADTDRFLAEAATADRRVLFEGAQGALLDISLGTYPFVTSSHTTTGGIVVGSGYPLRQLERVVGVTKAYATRVGEGPFPTELDDDEGKALASRGREFGATTGRPRRCGWLDLVALRHAAQVCGFTSLAVTKLDVLDTFERIGLGVAYDTDEGRLTHFPGDPLRIQQARPVVSYQSGWRQDLSGCRSVEELPAGCRALLDRIADFCDVKVEVISVGPGRHQTFVQSDPLWSASSGI